MKTNRFGAELDRAGYAPSIMQPMPRGRATTCYLCGLSGGPMDRHEPLGAANRQKSKELGLWVYLHHWGCHEGPGSVHSDGEKARQLRADAQTAAMLRYGWSREQWIAEFGKSELSEEECRRLNTVPGAVQRAISSPSPVAAATPSPAGGGKRGGAIDAEGTSHRAQRVSGFRLLDGPDLPF